MTSYTPGPWRVEETWSGLVVRGDRPVARIHDRFADGRAETFANARLIALAPRLVDVIRGIVADEGRSYGSIAAAAAILDELDGDA